MDTRLRQRGHWDRPVGTNFNISKLYSVSLVPPFALLNVNGSHQLYTSDKKAKIVLNKSYMCEVSHNNRITPTFIQTKITIIKAIHIRERAVTIVQFPATTQPW
jgi:hypothetical protein